jgi:transposase
VSDDDVLFGYRLRLFTLAAEIGVRAACRAMGVHHSTYYRWKRQVDRWGLEALRVRERRKPRMPNEIGPHLEQRIIAFSLAHPGFGPRRISAELARKKWGALRISQHGVWRVLRRVGLNTGRGKRLALIARHRHPYERAPSRHRRPRARHIEASQPGELVQMDCFFIGRLSAGARARRLAVHRDRGRLGLHLGAAARLRSQPALAPLSGAAARPRARALTRRLEAAGREHRQRL